MVSTTLYNGREFDLTSARQKQYNQNLNAEIKRLKDHVAAIGFGFDYETYILLESILPEVETVGGYRIKPEILYSSEDNNYYHKSYTEEQARTILKFVEKQALESKI